MVCQTHSWSPVNRCGKRDLYSHVGTVAYDFQTLHAHGARSRVLRNGPQCQQQQHSALFSGPHFSDFAVLRNSGCDSI